MWPGQRLDLGHSDMEAKLRGLPGDRLEHSACNRRAGQLVTTAILRARGGLTDRQVVAMRMRQWRATRKWLRRVGRDRGSRDHAAGDAGIALYVGRVIHDVS
jgi:hypothetical protein